MNKVAIIASLAAALALQQVANAGTVYKNPILIYHGSGDYATVAGGSFHQALLSSDSLEYIGCMLTSNNGWTEIICHARNATATDFASCWIAPPSQTLLQIVGSINEYSFIEFAADNTGQCTYVTVDNTTYNK